jgi:hypothetical protein
LRRPFFACCASYAGRESAEAPYSEGGSKSVLSLLRRGWIASRSLSSGARTRDPLARNDDVAGYARLSPCLCEKRLRRSNPSRGKRRDGLLRGACHRARIRATRWLAMTRKHVCPFSRHGCPRFYEFVVPLLKKEGAGNAGCALHPRSRVPRDCALAHTSIQGSGEHSDIPRAMALRLTPRSPRRRIPFVTVICELAAPLARLGQLRLRRLGISNGCQDHTASPYATASLVSCAVRSLTRFISPCNLKHARRCRVHRIPSQPW